MLGDFQVLRVHEDGLSRTFVSDHFLVGGFHQEKSLVWMPCFLGASSIDPQLIKGRCFRWKFPSPDSIGIGLEAAQGHAAAEDGLGIFGRFPSHGRSSATAVVGCVQQWSIELVNTVGNDHVDRLIRMAVPVLFDSFQRLMRCNSVCSSDFNHERLGGR